MLQLYLMHLIFVKSVVNGHGRGKRRGKRLGAHHVLQPGASGVVSLQHVSMSHYARCAQAWTRHAPRYMPCASAAYIVCREFAACVIISICWLFTGMDEASALVHALCFSQVRWVLL